MERYETVSAVLSELKERRYRTLFQIEQGCLLCSPTKVKLEYKEIQVDNVYCISEEDDSRVDAIVYAISSLQKSIKGILVSTHVTDPFKNK